LPVQFGDILEQIVGKGVIIIDYKGNHHPEPLEPL
jgi:hypothetical protein